MRAPVSDIAVVTFLWGSRYQSFWVDRLYKGLKRNSRVPFTFYCFIDRPQKFVEGVVKKTLWREFAELGRCYRRMRMYKGDVRDEVPHARIVMLDIDTIVVGDVTHLLTRDESFVIWKAPSIMSGHGYTLNPSYVSMKPGAVTYVYRQFAADPKAAIEAARKEKWTGSDQSVLSHLLRNHEIVGKADGIYSFRDDKVVPLPKNAALVTFLGNGHDPTQNHIQNFAPWIREHWV